MKKTTSIILIGIGILGYFIIVSGNHKQTEGQNYSIQASESQSEAQVQPAEKIEVIHFHGTHQCSEFLCSDSVLSKVARRIGMKLV